MANIKVEKYDPTRHRNPMWYIDDVQRALHEREPSLITYKVCLVRVCGFTFTFHSLTQIRLCLAYYELEYQPSSRLPVYQKNLGGDHWEMQRWFEKLPMYLLEKPKRSKVVAALKKAMKIYAQVPEARTGTPPGDLLKWA